MRQKFGMSAALAFGLAVGAACSDRKAPEEDEEAYRLCNTWCGRFEECNVPPELPTVEECTETCVNYDWLWRESCREENVSQYECLNALACDDFAITQDFDADAELKSCQDEREVASSCIAANGGIDGGG